MEIREISKEVYNFQKKRFPQVGSKLDAELMFLHLSEEIGEVARQLFNKNSGMRGFDRANLQEEIAQAILDLLVLAELNKIDLDSALKAKLKEIKSRSKPK